MSFMSAFSSVIDSILTVIENEHTDFSRFPHHVEREIMENVRYKIDKGIYLGYVHNGHISAFSLSGIHDALTLSPPFYNTYYVYPEGGIVFDRLLGRFRVKYPEMTYLIDDRPEGLLISRDIDRSMIKIQPFSDLDIFPLPNYGSLSIWEELVK